VLVLRGTLTIAPDPKPVLNSETTVVPWQRDRVP